MKFLLAKKQKMTQFHDDMGIVTPATLLSAGPVVVTQVKDSSSDKYSAIQVGYGARSENKTNKPMEGHLSGVKKDKEGSFEVLKEFRLEKVKDASPKVGDTYTVSDFEVGDGVTISGISKGKGFQGVVKRHNFKGGPRSHGQKHSEREPGSIGATGPQRVFKGVRMGGRMGSDRVTVSGLKVLSIDKEKNEMLVSGSIPGHRGTLLEIRG